MHGSQSGKGCGVLGILHTRMYQYIPQSNNDRESFMDTRNRGTMAPSTIQVSGTIGALNR